MKLTPLQSMTMLDMAVMAQDRKAVLRNERRAAESFDDWFHERGSEEMPEEDGDIHIGDKHEHHYKKPSGNLLKWGLVAAGLATGVGIPGAVALNHVLNRSDKPPAETPVAPSDGDTKYDYDIRGGYRAGK